jgi:UDP-N-acetylmuramyl pentapeptide phosphotransferase/UDP-N-acetylglucosamine-1-phosphate transferase
MFIIISFILSLIIAIVLHSSTRRFVRNRLRYVDAVQKTIAPWAAGGAVFLVSLLLVPILPLVGIGTAITAALAVGSGVAAGARDIRQGTTPIIYGA